MRFILCCLEDFLWKSCYGKKFYYNISADEMKLKAQHLHLESHLNSWWMGRWWQSSWATLLPTDQSHLEISTYDIFTVDFIFITMWLDPVLKLPWKQRPVLEIIHSKAAQLTNGLCFCWKTTRSQGQVLHQISSTDDILSTMQNQIQLTLLAFS